MARKEHPQRRFFTTSDVARYCEVSADGVLKWIKAGKLRAFATPGGHYRISAEDLRSFLERYDIPIQESFFRPVSGSRTVLIVDDEPTVREIIERRLRELDPELRVEQAADGYEAGIKIGGLEPDLVIVDAMMPRIDGVSLCRSIRANPDTRHVRILAITASPDAEVLRRMDDAGADLCMTKPLDFERFTHEVGRLLDAGGARPGDVRRAQH